MKLSNINIISNILVFGVLASCTSKNSGDNGGGQTPAKNPSATPYATPYNGSSGGGGSTTYPNSTPFPKNPTPAPTVKPNSPTQPPQSTPAPKNPNGGGTNPGPQPTTAPLNPNPKTQIPSDGMARIGDVQISLPAGWGISQRATVGDTAFLILRNQDKMFSIYLNQSGNVNLQNIFKNSTPDQNMNINGLDIQRVNASNTVSGRLPLAGTYYSAGFMFKKNNATYYGYSRDTSAQNASAVLQEILPNIQ